MLCYTFGPKSSAFFAQIFHSVSALLVPLRYSAFSGKNGPKTAVAQRSGPFLRACTRSVSVDVAEFRYATLKLRGILLRYAALTATVSVAGPALLQISHLFGLVQGCFLWCSSLEVMQLETGEGRPLWGKIRICKETQVNRQVQAKS
jgi:hypothetical protein